VSVISSWKLASLCPPAQYVSLVGANIKMTMLSAKLNETGYSTHVVGKWHQGFFEEKYFPQV